VHDEAFRFEATDESVAVVTPEGRRHAVAIATLEEVAVETNDSGPWGADVWFVFRGPDGACPVPQGARGEDAMWDVFRRLPGFDHARVAEAMTGAQNATFVVWRRGGKGSG
jgi:hypothetical protein